MTEPAPWLTITEATALEAAGMLAGPGQHVMARIGGRHFEHFGPPGPAAPRHPFDWSAHCPEDVGAREFPAVVGTGRGKPLAEVLRAQRRDRTLDNFLRMCGP